jgi:rubredoxin
VTAMDWDHVHQCGVCGYVIRIDQIDLKVITGGVITCPKCEASGPINVKIMDEKMIPEPHTLSSRNRQ